jgi:hypothetical protein
MPSPVLLRHVGGGQGGGGGGSRIKLAGDCLAGTVPHRVGYFRGWFVTCAVGFDDLVGVGALVACT